MEAFFALAKDSAEISITSIVRKAGYNRGTFYLYFTDLQDLKQQMEDEFLEDFRQWLQFRMKMNSSDKQLSLSTFLEEILDPYSERLFLLLRVDTMNRFLPGLHQILIELLPSWIPNKEYTCVFMISAQIGTLLYWNGKGRKEDLGIVCASLEHMLTYGVLHQEKEGAEALQVSPCP